MLIPPRYRFTKNISSFLSTIEASREVINSTSTPLFIEEAIRRESTLKSSLFSARIEGNTMTLEDIELNPKEKKKIEVANILTALNFIRDNPIKVITSKRILKLQGIAMKHLLDYENIGKYRKNHEAIFNSGGIAVYMPPSPTEINSHIENLVKYINSKKERFVPIKAVLSHFIFEKIHPFLDGSGRVGRLLLQQVLSSGEYGMKGILPIEEYLEAHRSEYYCMLEEPEKDATDYVEYMLKALAETSVIAKDLILKRKNYNVEDGLLPRRAEILRIIKDQKMVTFNLIHRRFIDINERTLRYDIKKLIDAKLIKKLGTTRGVYYSI